MTAPRLTVADVAELSSLSRKAVRGAIARGDLVAYKLCGQIRIDEADYERWVARSRVDLGTETAAPPARLPTPRKPTGRLRSALAVLSESEEGPALRKQPGPVAPDERTVMRETEATPSPSEAAS